MKSHKIRTTVNTAYVFSSISDKKTILAGRMEISAASGTFRYSDEWLDSKQSYPLDPVNLPLTKAIHTTRSRTKVFGVFSDAGPDDWGTKVMFLGHSRLPTNEIERLLACSGHGVGCLEFSLSRSRPKQPPELPSTNILKELEEASLAMANDKLIDDDMYRILAPGTSMGGARPKVSVRDDDNSWLAKFSLPQDSFNMPLSEWATLELARQAGISVPETRIVKLGNHQALLVDRFDYTSQPIHFISAHSLFNQDRLKQYADAAHDPCSYPRLAKVLRAHSSVGIEDCVELYRRMVFNTLIGNTDDHAKNHAVIYKVSDRQWRLSPAYDMVPIASASQQQALSIGRFGRESSVENLLSMPEAFGINRQQATRLIQDQLHILNGWEKHFADHDVPPASIKVIRKIVQPKLGQAEKALLQ